MSDSEENLFGDFSSHSVLSTDQESKTAMHQQHQRTCEYGPYDQFGNLWLRTRLVYNQENMPELQKVFELVGAGSRAAVLEEDDTVWVIGRNEELLAQGVAFKGLDTKSFLLLGPCTSFSVKIV